MQSKLRFWREREAIQTSGGKSLSYQLLLHWGGAPLAWARPPPLPQGEEAAPSAAAPVEAAAAPPLHHRQGAEVEARWGPVGAEPPHPPRGGVPRGDGWRAEEQRVWCVGAWRRRFLPTVGRNDNVIHVLFFVLMFSRAGQYSDFTINIRIWDKISS